MIAEILRVKHLAKHIHIENALSPVCVLRENKIAGYGILQLYAFCRSLSTLFERLIATIGRRVSLLRCSDLSIENENALRGGVKNGGKGEVVSKNSLVYCHLALTKLCY